MTSLPPEQTLPLAVEALRSRVGKEIARLQGLKSPGTDSVGGWARLGALLDALTLAAFRARCDELGERSEDVFRRVAEREQWSLVKAGAGQLCVALAALPRTTPSRDRLLPGVTLAAGDPRSPLRAAIAMRNDVVHGREPAIEAQRAQLASLGHWLDALPT